jgi:hypothetical protein
VRNKKNSSKIPPFPESELFPRLVESILHQQQIEKIPHKAAAAVAEEKDRLGDECEL